MADALQIAVPPRRASDGVGPVFENDLARMILLPASATGPAAAISLQTWRDSGQTAKELAIAVGMPTDVVFSTAGENTVIEGHVVSGERIILGHVLSWKGSAGANGTMDADIGPASDLSRAKVTVSSDKATALAAHYVECKTARGIVHQPPILTLLSDSVAWTFMVQSGEHGAGVVAVDAQTGAVVQWTGLISV